MTKFFAFVFLLFFIASCAPSRYVVPLKRHEHSVSLNLGGPLINFSGLVIPVPFTSVNYAYGWKKETTVFGSLHPTALAYGVGQIELGLVHRVHYFEGSKIGISLSPVLNFMMDRWEWNPRLYPQLDLNMYWNFAGDLSRHCDCPGDKDASAYMYFGISNWVDLHKTRANNQAQPQNWFLVPQLGINAGGASWRYSLEFKYMGLFTPNNNVVVSYYNPISTSGAIGVYATVYKTFGAK
ncbi:MAG: hypothetical protein NT150_07185 [Bacteroidetes bacterium]|nr:hypothetical protein [Bacteroidota bacterium]